MPWMECLLFAAIAGIVVLVVRGIAQIVAWIKDEFLPEPIKSKQKPPPRHRETAPAGHKQTILKMTVLALPIHPVRWLTAVFGRLLNGKKYDYWVAAALGESDPDRKVTYCSKALKLNPGYEPGWGLKATALFQLNRYDEAAACFDKVLELRPHAMAWHKKGLCCYHLKQYEDAVACFDKTLATCKDKELFDEVSRRKKEAEAEMRLPG